MPEQLIRVNGVELCGEGFGDPSAPLLLLIHGTGSSMLSWDEELCERLAAGQRFVVRYDSRDAGRSIGAAGDGDAEQHFLRVAVLHLHRLCAPAQVVWS